MREGHAATMCNPECSHIAEVLDRNTNQRAALQLFGHAHAGHKGEPDFELDETLDRFHSGQLESDVERRMVLGERLHYLVTRTGLDIMCQEGLVSEFFDCD